MFDQLNRFMALLVLFGLLTRPAMAVPDGYQTLVVDGDTLVVQMAESLPTEEPSLAASDDSLSAQTKAMETSLDYWTGRIEQNTTWRDTVYVIGDVTIASGATLTLAPDTQVHFMPYHDDTQGGLDPTRAELVVEGGSMPMRAASSFVRRMLLRWGPTGMALSLSAVASPTYPTPRYETVFAAYMPRWVGASRWIMSLLPTVGS